MLKISPAVDIRWPLPLGSGVGIHPPLLSPSMFRMKSAHALLQWERRYSGGVDTSVCSTESETSTATRTSPRKAAVWAKPTVSISAVCSAGLKKQEKWPENTENEPAEARNAMRPAGECS